MIPGRLILPALRWRDDTGFLHEAGTIAAALGFGAGGFILFGGTPEAVKALTTELRERAGRPLLIAADLERGAGQQFPGLTEFPPPGALASLDDPDAIRAAATTTAREALSLGINWVLAPVADLDIEPANPIVQTRSFGADPARVAGAVATWVEACQAAGALACVKHFPGHGRTTRDSHDDLPTVDADLATLEATDLVPFRRGISAGVATVMTGHLRVPALDPSGAPATFSSAILGYLRNNLGFDGLIVTDALMMGAAAGGEPGAPAVRALAAGCDLLCYPADPIAAERALAAAIESGVLPESRVFEAVKRYDMALARAGGKRGSGASRPPGASRDPAGPEQMDPGFRRGDRQGGSGAVRHPSASRDPAGPEQMDPGLRRGDSQRGSGAVRHPGASRDPAGPEQMDPGFRRGDGGDLAMGLADRLLSRGLTRGAEPRFTTPIDLVIVDDDQGGAWPASSHDYLTIVLQDAHVALGPGGSRVVLAFAEPRASKGRAGFGAESLEVLEGFAREADAVVLFGHPRLAAQVPRGAPLLVAWHRQRLMQEAAARWILERLG